METETADSCFRCGLCCKKYQPILNVEEVRFIAHKLGFSYDQFRTEYADPRWPFDHSMLIRHKNGACPFLKINTIGKEALCSIHSFKPSCCREWESRMDRKDCREGLKAVWDLEIDNNGQIYGSSDKVAEFVAFQRSTNSGGS